jgi:hypothetical protein
LVGAPVTGGGPLRPSGIPWVITGLLATVFAGALYARIRRHQINRS